MEKPRNELAKWTHLAQGVLREQIPRFPVPVPVLFDEAVEVSKFFKKRWKIQLDADKKVVCRGLEMALPKKPNQNPAQGLGRSLHAAMGQEILSLQYAAREAQVGYLYSIGKSDNIFERGKFLVKEMTAALTYHLGAQDAQLCAARKAHADDGRTLDELASALVSWAALAELHREDIDGLGDFDVAHIEEAHIVAKELLLRPSRGVVQPRPNKDLLLLRNQVIALLMDRMETVRTAARFVFRRQPDIISEVTSAYGRKQRAAQRAKQAAEKEAAQKESPPE